jgi:hypothetical protein
MPEIGTVVTAVFGFNHIDRLILGDISGTITFIIAANPSVHLVYKYCIEYKVYIFNTREIKKILEEPNISKPMITNYLNELIQESLKGINAST